MGRVDPRREKEQSDQPLKLCAEQLYSLAGHDGRSRLVLGQLEFTETASRTRSEVPDVVGNLHEADSDNVEGTGGLDDSVVSGKGLKLIELSC